MPKTQFGKYAVASFVTFIACFVLAQMAVMLGQRGGDSFFDNLWISLPMSLAFVSVLVGAGFGIISIIRDKERSPLIFLIAAIGLLILIFLLGEFLLPH